MDGSVSRTDDDEGPCGRGIGGGETYPAPFRLGLEADIEALLAGSGVSVDAA